MADDKKNKDPEVDRKFLIPAQVRTFIDTLSGERSPITEKNFSKTELKQIREAVQRSRKRGSKSQTVDYADYYDNGNKRDNSVIKDFSVLPGDAARNTLGRFKYEKTPEGRLVVTDSYDFKDDLVEKNPNIPKSKDYEGLSALGKAAKLAKDSFNPKMGGLTTLPSRVGSAYIGKTSRPVKVDLGEADFKKGGKIKASSASKRADGCAKRGKTRGRMV